MPIRIRSQDFVIEMDTAEEVRTVLLMLRGMNGKGTVSTPEMPAIVTETPQRDLRGFFNRLPDNQQRFLKALRQSDKGLTDTQLRQQLGYKDNSAMAGVITGIVKNAQKAGLQSRQVFHKDKQGRQGSRIYTYRLTAAMLETIPAELPLT